jgi:hypothetical protein
MPWLLVMFRHVSASKSILSKVGRNGCSTAHKSTSVTSEWSQFQCAKTFRYGSPVGTVWDVTGVTGPSRYFCSIFHCGVHSSPKVSAAKFGEGYIIKYIFHQFFQLKICLRRSQIYGRTVENDGALAVAVQSGTDENFWLLDSRGPGA